MRPRNVVVSLVDAVPPVVAQRFRGDSRLASLVRPIANLLLPKDLTWITVRAGTGAGLRLVIDPRLEKSYWSGLFEPRVQAAVTQGLWPKSLSTRAACRIGRPRMARHLGRHAQAQTFGHRPSAAPGPHAHSS